MSDEEEKKTISSFMKVQIVYSMKKNIGQKNNRKCTLKSSDFVLYFSASRIHG